MAKKHDRTIVWVPPDLKQRLKTQAASGGFSSMADYIEALMPDSKYESGGFLAEISDTSALDESIGGPSEGEPEPVEDTEIPDLEEQPSKPVHAAGCKCLTCQGGD